jgi:predicted GNAT family N-acyltransferase
MSAQVAPLLVLAWGNPSRGDDALGPLLAERLLIHVQTAGLASRVEVLTDFQLQVEHALDLVGRERILFVDAALDLAEPFTVRPLQAARGGGIGHALMAESVRLLHQLWGPQPIRIGAQAHLERFYNRHGFVSDNKPYIEDGIPHLEMVRR